jgi:hypothetical protein
MAENVKKYDNHKRQFDENQYEMLIRCSGKQDITNWKVNLKDAKFVNVIVDDQTFIWGCDFNKQTNFTGVHLELARIDPYLKENLRNNIRQIRLENER